MTELTGQTNRLLDLLRTDDPKARNRLIGHADERLRLLTRKMLREFPGVKRWEQTDDVLQAALLRLCKALSEVKPESPRHFWNLAAQHIRWELLDLARRHFGPRGIGVNHHTDGDDKAREGRNGILDNLPARTGEPTSPEEWAQLLEEVEKLPEQEREVFGLLWEDDLTQEEAAAVLKVSLKTVKRRWQLARLKLRRRLDGESPQESEGKSE